MSRFDADTLIVGGGLAGAAAALHLSRHEQVLVLEAKRPAAGASGAAAGLVNPLMARKARPVWRLDAALDALHQTLDLADASALFHRTGVLRPAIDTKQASFFKDAARHHAAHASWLSPEASIERYPLLRAPHGALLIHTGGHIDVARFVEAMLRAAGLNGAPCLMDTQVVAWSETQDGVRVEARRDDQPISLHARRLILAMGYGLLRHDATARLHLHAIKGQTVFVQRPGAVAPDTLPALSGHGYVVPGERTFALGSSYEHTFSDLTPSPAVSEELRRNAARMVSALGNAPIAEARAGARVTVPGTRLPMAGPLPGSERIWVFTGLGSKGLLMAPLVARTLPRFFRDPAQIPHDLRVRRGQG